MRDDPSTERRGVASWWAIPAMALLLSVVAACEGLQGPSIRDRLARVTPPAEGPREPLLWEGWHPIELPEDLRSPLLVVHGLADDGYVVAALDYLAALSAAHPGRAALLEAQGVLRARLGFHRAAEHDFERALELDRTRPELWYALGRTRLALDLPAAAVETLRRALELGADDALVHRDLARAFRTLGRRVDAAHHYEQMLRRDGGRRTDLLVEAATLATARGGRGVARPGWERAFGLLDEALTENPGSTQAWFVRGLLSEYRGDLPGALDAYGAALEHDPLHLPSLTNLSLVARRARESARCREAARGALAIETDPRRRKLLEGLIAVSAPTSPARE